MEELLPQYAAAPSSESARLLIRFRIADESELNWLLSQITGSIVRQDWQQLAYTFDHDGYAEQFALMKRANAERSDADVVAQILAETIGLGMVDNNLSTNSVRDPENPFAGLNRIRSVELTGVDPSGSEYRQVDGFVTLEDGTFRSLSFSVFQNADGEWRINVPVG